MKTFSTFKAESKIAKPIVKTDVQSILSNLTVHVDAELNDKVVEIVGLDDAEFALNEHIEKVKHDVRKETIFFLEESLKNGDSWNLIVEKILNNEI